MSFLTSVDTFDYVVDRNPNEDKIQFEFEFNLTDPSISEIPQRLLEFNPHFRSSAREILKSPVFNSVRDPQLEKRAKDTIHLKIDEDGAFDYIDENGSLSYFIYDVRTMVEHEVQKLRTVELV